MIKMYLRFFVNAKFEIRNLCIIFQSEINIKIFYKSPLFYQSFLFHKTQRFHQ